MVFRFAGAQYPVSAPETVLQTLLRSGVEIAFSCGKGICQACLLRSRGGAPPVSAQAGLRDTLRQQGYFLACLCPASDDMDVVPPQLGDVFGPARVSGKEQLAADIFRLRLEPASALDYRPGQFVNLRRADGLVRSYSIASVPALDSGLELHVQRRRNGAMSQWIADTVRVGDAIDLGGPGGNCFYLPGNRHDPLLLIGTGSGLAPLLGIARDALSQGHQGAVDLYHGSRGLAGLYGRAQLLALAAQYANFHAHFCVSDEAADAQCLSGRVKDIALSRHTDLSGFRVYLCGAPQMVREAQKAAYLGGARMQDIHADAFENKELRAVSRD